MTNQGGSFEKLSVPLSEWLNIQDSIAGTFTARAHRAVELSSQQPVTVWRTRGPIAAEDHARFQARMDRIRGIRGVQPILRCGIDSNSIGFAVLLDFRGKKLASRAKDRDELQARFDGCVRIVESLHEGSIQCGDLCLDSFVITENGDISFFSVLGDVTLESLDDEFNQAAFLAFRPPEQRAGAALKPGFDIYALGWIADGLFASEVSDLSEISHTPPSWLKNVLSAAATEELRDQITSARSIRMVIEGGADGGGSQDRDKFALVEVADAEQASGGEVSGSTGASQASHPEEQRQEDSSGPSAHLQQPKTGTLNTGRHSTLSGAGVGGDKGLGLVKLSNRVVLLTLANIVAVGVLLVSYLDARSFSAQVAAEKVEQIGRITENQEAVRKLYESNAPVAHQELLGMLKTAPSAAEREDILDATLYRARRLGLLRGVDIALGLYSDTANPGSFSTEGVGTVVLRVLDPAMSSSQRTVELVKLYESEPSLATNLGAALALDSGDAEPYRGLLTRAAADQVGVASGGEHNPYALMLLLPDAHALFSEDLVERSDKIPSSDITWLLQEIGRKGQAEVSTVAQLAYNREVISGLRGIFVKELQRGVALSPSLRASLVAGALGELSDKDIHNFGDWYGQGSSRVLEAGILTSGNRDISATAFQALSTKPLADPYVAKVMEFIINAYDQQSPQYGGIVAVLALRGVVDSRALSEELRKVKQAPRKREFLKHLIQGAPPEVLVALVELHGDIMDPLDLVDLLANPSPAVRKTAITHLADVNDIILLKLISQRYDEERDPEVRALYEERVSIVRSRKGPPV